MVFAVVRGLILEGLFGSTGGINELATILMEPHLITLRQYIYELK